MPPPAFTFCSRCLAPIAPAEGRSLVQVEGADPRRAVLCADCGRAWQWWLLAGPAELVTLEDPEPAGAIPSG